MLWFVGRSKASGEWTTGGTSADYPREHWDVYVEQASDRDAALKLAKQSRRRQLKASAARA